MFVISENRLGLQQIGVSSATAQHPLGTIVRADDPVYGEGEFIYLLGVAATILGSVVTYNGNTAGAPTYQTTLAPATAGLAQPVAFATGVNLAGSFGWYQISGAAIAATNGTLAAGPGPIYLAGAGQVTSTQAAGKQISGAVNVTATGTPVAGQAVIEIDRPSAQGQIV